MSNRRARVKSRSRVVIAKDGPYQVSGRVPLARSIAKVGRSGEPEEWAEGERFPKQETYLLCRCGKSRNKPFCDGAHARVGFKGTETASREPFARQARRFKGPELELLDAEELCSSARFCLRAGGTWRNVHRSDRPKAKKVAIETAGDCPSGRLVVRDRKTGKVIEPGLRPGIGLIEDPQLGVSGPVWLKGGIELESADGAKYETRNRMTLCRCGASKNKPFCDGSHITIRFNDGHRSLKPGKAD